MTAAARVLYVDDEETMRLLVQEHLSAEGYNVATATNGDEAVKTLETKTFDLVILDILMPGMSGIGVLQEMKARNIKPRVIVLTGVDDLDVAVNAAKLGAIDYVTKPFEMKDLLGSIRRVLQV